MHLQERSWSCTMHPFFWWLKCTKDLYLCSAFCRCSSVITHEQICLLGRIVDMGWSSLTALSVYSVQQRGQQSPLILWDWIALMGQKETVPHICWCWQAWTDWGSGFAAYNTEPSTFTVDLFASLFHCEDVLYVVRKMCMSLGQSSVSVSPFGSSFIF